MMWRFKEYGDKIAALDDTGNAVTYTQLEELSDIFRKFAHRKLIFHICRNAVGSFAGYAAMINAGAVPVMIAEDMDKALMENLWNVYHPDFIWVPSERQAQFRDEGAVYQAYDYALVDVKETPDKGEELYGELALLLTTSGSTGSPKLVRQSYANIRANTESIVQYLELDETERPITTLPMNYTYGLSIINSHLYVGATLLMTQYTLVQKEFWEFLKSQQATSFGGVPYTYEMLKKLRYFRMELPSIRTMTQAGGKLTPELHKEFAEYAQTAGKKFVVMYGQTEATARMAYLPADKALEKAGSMGIAIPGGHFDLIDAQGNIIEEPDTVGELVYKGENVTLGYALSRSDLAKGDERGGRLETGDMAKRDRDGYYYIVGRKKRFLKMFGKRVNMDEIDCLVKEKFDGIECASTGVDDTMYIFVDNKEVINSVHGYVAEKIHINSSAIRVKYIASIPKNESGKTLYTKLEAYYD